MLSFEYALEQQKLNGQGVDSDDAPAAQVSCDIFQEDPIFGFLRCKRCSVKRHDHFDPIDLSFERCMVSQQGDLHMRKKTATAKGEAEWKQQVVRLKGTVIFWPHAQKFMDRS